MIAHLHMPKRAPLVVELPSCPEHGDAIERDGERWRVADRKFVLPHDGDAYVVVTLEAEAT